MSDRDGTGNAAIEDGSQTYNKDLVGLSIRSASGKCVVERDRIRTGTKAVLCWKNMDDGI